MKRKIWVLLFLIGILGGFAFFPENVLAEEIDPANYQMIHYGVDSGLNSLEINAITQTKEGYIWAGSYCGLYRYDGTRFEEIKLDDRLSSIIVLYVDMIRSQYGIEVDSEEKEETLEKETEETVKENMEQEGVLAMSEVMALLEKIMDFDQDEVLGRLAEFQSRKLPKKQADQIDAIKQAMEAFDWDLAQEKTQELMEQLE